MGVTVSLPNTLTNGTTADAGQVMANFDALVNALGNAASTGGDTITGNWTMSNGKGLVASGGAQLITGSGGGTWSAKAGTSTSDAFSAQDVNGNTVFDVGNGGTAGNPYYATVNGVKLLQALSGGYKVQSGSVTVNANTAQTVTFPTAFASAPLIFVSPFNSSGYAWPTTQTTTNFAFQSNINASVTFEWIAIGS